MVYKSGAWETWKAPEGHPQRIAFDNLERVYFAGEYEGQKQQLDLLHTVAGLDVYAASYSLYEEEEGGAYFSMAVWSKSVDTLLPRADYVGFVDMDLPEGESFLGRMKWDDFVKHFGSHLKRDPNRYPARYQTQNYPDLELIEKFVE